MKIHRAIIASLCPVIASLCPVHAEQVVINEVMYHPPAGLYEFVEIENLTATVFDIASWKLRGGVDFDFPVFNGGSPTESFLKAFERIVICETDPATFRAAYGLSPSVRVFGPWTGLLENSGERITLKDKNGVTRCTMRYADTYPWPVAADGAGHSLVLADTSFAIDDYRVWRASPSKGGTPGNPEAQAAEEPFPNPEVDLTVGIPFIDMGDTWKYDDSNPQYDPNPTPPTLAWYDPAFNDGSWSSGPGLFGFEPQSVPPPGIQTPFQDPAQNDIITYYFRKEFQYNGPLSGINFSIDTILDDGAGFRLNGKWIGGTPGMGEGVPASQGAGRTISDASEEAAIISGTLPLGNGASLVNGTNVLAVEVHQTSATSSDIIFGARLNIAAPTEPSVVINEVLPAGAGNGFVEFYNPTLADIDIGGWYLSDTASNLTKFQIPGSLNVPTSGFASVGFTESNLSLAAPTQVFLTKSDGVTTANGISATIPSDGRSLGRKPSGAGTWFLFMGTTRDGPNASASALGDFLSINEVHFDPAGNIDWVELHNSGAAGVSTAGLFLSSKRSFSDKVALGGSVPGGGGTSSSNAAFTGTGNSWVLFLIDSSDAVIDAVSFERKAGRDHVAAFPDGSGLFYSSGPGSRDVVNNPSRETDVVINELMVETPSGHRDGEFIELYNKGVSSVDLTSWRFSEGVTFNFPAGSSIGPGQYVVIAANQQFTSDAHPSANVIGEYSGNLANRGERLVLLDDWDNVADGLHYHTGGNWPSLAAGMGSSLELRHPDMDNSKASSWADSNESNKSTFQTYTFSDTYLQSNSTGGTTDYRELHVHAVGDAHLALRNMSLRLNGVGANLLPGDGETVVTNGNASTGWLCQGTHYQSQMQGNEFHIISTGHGDVKANRCEIDAIGMNPGNNLTWSCEARWIYGKPTLVVNTWDRTFGDIIHLPVPKNLGTAGAVNSAALPGAPPTVSELTHSPAVPTSSDPVRITARVESTSGVPVVNLRHRLDNSTWSNPWLTVAMSDDGVTGGDELAFDGIYTVTLTQYQGDNNIVQFYVEASSTGGTSIQPPSALEAPAMYGVDNSGIPSDLRTQRFVMSQRDYNASNGGTSGSAINNYAFPRLSNQFFKVTFIGDESHIIYNCEMRKSGSPWTRSGGADFARAKWKTPGDRRFRGYSRRSIDNDAGGNRGYHNRIIRYWLYLLGHAANENEFVRVIVNGGSASLREDIEPNANDFLKRNWEDGEKGELYRIDDEWWFRDDWGRTQRNADWSYKGTSEPEEYHAEWIKRSREAEYDYSSFVSWVLKVGGNSFTREEIERMADIDMMAANAVVRGWCDDWDTLTRNRGKNGYFLRRYSDNKFMLVQWDSDLTFGNVNAPFLGNLAGVRNFFDKPYVQQRYHYYLGEMIDKYTHNSPRLTEWLNLEEAASTAYTPTNTRYSGGFPAWNAIRVGQAANEIGSTALNANFNVTTGGGVSTTTSADTITLNGTSPYNAFSIVAVGHPEAEWNFTSETVWTLSGIQLQQGSNFLTLQALDSEGNVVATDTFTVNKNGNALPVIVLDADPSSYHIAVQDSLTIDAAASYDPEGTALAFSWSVDDPIGADLTNPTSDTAVVSFDSPGLYTVSVTATDGNSQQHTEMRQVAVYQQSGWSPFTDRVLEDSWTEESIEVRHDYSVGAWYSLDDRVGQLTLKINDDTAKPLTGASPIHPVLWRDLPDNNNCVLQTDLRLVSVQQGDFNAGLIVEVQEGLTSSRYAFSMEDGDFLRVERSIGGNYSTVATLNPWTQDDAVIRIRRVGSQLFFDYRTEPGVWANLYTRALPGSATMGRGGIFAATDSPQAARFEFDYMMVVDPDATSPTVESLRITEVMYFPTGGGQLEFIEFTNTSATTLDLEGVTFEEGDPFDELEFGTVSLDPGEYGVVVSDLTAFQAEYGGAIKILGQWAGGALKNEGETVVLSDPGGDAIHDFAYDDLAPWPVAAAGLGPSLEVIDTEGDYNDPLNWRASVVNGGTPGFGLVVDSDGDGLSDADEIVAGTDPLNPDSDFDGALDGAEVFAGTDPLDSLSVFEISNITRDDVSGDVTVFWTSVSGRTYTLESNPDLETGNWTVIATGIVASGSSTFYLDTGVPLDKRYFYRAKVE